MSGDNSVIAIRATSKRNGITTTVIGVALVVFGFMLLSLFREYLFLAGVFVASAGIVGIIMGWFKIREPEHSVLISPEGIRYIHRHGEWQVSWDNVQRIDAPRVTRGVTTHNLDMLGIRLRDWESIVHNISPRLATNILMEQRPLLLQNPDDKCVTGTCASSDLLEDDRFKLSSGEFLVGIKAMFAHRMCKLRERLGFDLYIAAAELDRPVLEFVQLLRDVQSQQQKHHS
ncbi:DUF2982 domain-containing protein [Alteromonas facilis]|uniref:DUF2982 domain-containing protein n=1 Tax=Alteromonas facilis TaxID=2048004 RepID=UPI000C28C337|nr:DUF2982 domain-containing protein [Alteromonas facilis]